MLVRGVVEILFANTFANLLRLDGLVLLRPITSAKPDSREQPAEASFVDNICRSRDLAHMFEFMANNSDQPLQRHLTVDLNTDVPRTGARGYP